MRDMEFRAAEIDAVADLVPEAQKIVKHAQGPQDECAARRLFLSWPPCPPEMLVFIEVEMPNPKALSKIRNYIQKWRPMRLALPVAELDALGVPRGPKFDKIIEQIFEMQLRGKARTPEDRTKALRTLAGIKEEPKKKKKKTRRSVKEARSPRLRKRRMRSIRASRLLPAQRRAGAKSAASEATRVSAGAASGAKAQAKHERASAPAATKRPIRGQSEGAGKEIAWQVTASGE